MKENEKLRMDMEKEKMEVDYWKKYAEKERKEKEELKKENEKLRMDMKKRISSVVPMVRNL